jgi:hypothetical protein
MKSGLALLGAVVITLIILVVAAYAWWHYTGWQTFTYSAGDSPEWRPTKEAHVSRLRFKDCAFQVQGADGVVRKVDAAPALNSMAVAYKNGARGAVPSALALVRPLNPFSFVIRGFNDRASVSDPSDPAWCGGGPCQGVTLSGKVRTI